MGCGGNSHEVILSYLAVRILCGTDPPGSEGDEEEVAWIQQAYLSDRSMDELRVEAWEAVVRDKEAIHAGATALCEDNPTLSGSEWEFIIDVIDEGGDWRTELDALRRQWGHRLL